MVGNWHFTSLCIAGLVAACSSSSTPTVPPGTVATVTMNAANWQFQYSPNMPPTPTQTPNGWQFTFPPQNGVHYLLHPTMGRLGTSISMTYQVAGDGQLIEVQPCGDTNVARVRIMFQQRGDNLSGAGVYEFYRWWSAEGYLLDQATHTVTINLDPSLWVSVYGKPGTDPLAAAGFVAATQDLEFVGVTFGGCFAGHGVYANGNSTFTMSSFSL